MKIGFIGCVESSELALKTILKTENVEVVGVITKEISAFNSDHVDLSYLCEKHNVPFHFEDSSDKSASVKFMKKLNPDVIYCFGWSYLLKDDFLTMPALGVIGFHPAKLPKNRGRHPIIWALALGLNKTASTFFKMEQGADTGPILSQVDINITHEDNAKTLYQKIIDSSEVQIKNFTTKLINNQAFFEEQDHSQSSTWRKRTRKDGLIDWRMTAEDIYNLIRALTKPYPGAEFKNEEMLMQVWDSRICDKQYPRNIEPGYILKTHKMDLLVKCSGTNAIWLLNLDSKTKLQEGDYL
jgi:methionyl-tRNA formyltransferase